MRFRRLRRLGCGGSGGSAGRFPIVCDRLPSALLCPFPHVPVRHARPSGGWISIAPDERATAYPWALLSLEV